MPGASVVVSVGAMVVVAGGASVVVVGATYPFGPVPAVSHKSVVHKLYV